MAFNRYEIDKTTKILKNDKNLQNTFSDENIFLEEEDFVNIAKVLLENKEQINNNSIEELNQISPPVARNEIVSILEVNYISANLYKQIIYTFKYSTIKIFFHQNYSKFMPDYDFTVINSKPKIKLFMEAFMKEYDRFASIIDEMYNLVDVDKTPEEYLNYLAQVVGYEREDSKLLNNVSFRELIKNIVEIYKIKGTNYSFELFFNFLGFNAELKEYWFDKRFGDEDITSNPETGVSNKNIFTFYLSTKKPTKYIPEGMRKPYTIAEDKIIGTLDVNEFNRKISQGEYTAKQLLGNELGYSGKHYTFFKTNVMQYNLESIPHLEYLETSEEGQQELSSTDLESIKRYVDFLTPIFMQKNVAVSIKPFEDDGTIIFPTDIDREDPRSSTNLNESMLHYYEGYQPVTYYWEDGVKYYNEEILRRNKSGIRNDISNPEGGGHFISGFYTDTTEKIKAIKENLESEFPNYTDSQIAEELSNRISDKSIFSNYFPDRDLISPYIEEGLNVPYNRVLDNEIIRNVPLRYNNNFSFLKGSGSNKRFSEALNEQLDNKTKILSIDLDNGEGNSRIRINKESTYRYINKNDTIKIMYTEDFMNSGVFNILEVYSISDYIYITIDGQLNSDQETPGGFIQIYYEDWKIQDFNFPFMFDRIFNIEVSEEQKLTSNNLYDIIEYTDYFYQFLEMDRNIFSQLYYYIDEVPNQSISTDKEMKNSDMSDFIDFYTLSERNFKMIGIEEVLYNSTAYTRNSFDFYAINPDFCWDYLDVTKA